MNSFQICKESNPSAFLILNRPSIAKFPSLKYTFKITMLSQFQQLYATKLSKVVKLKSCDKSNSLLYIVEIVTYL